MAKAASSPQACRSMAASACGNRLAFGWGGSDTADVGEVEEVVGGVRHRELCALGRASTVGGETPDGAEALQKRDPREDAGAGDVEPLQPDERHGAGVRHRDRVAGVDAAAVVHRLPVDARGQPGLDAAEVVDDEV